MKTAKLRFKGHSLSHNPSELKITVPRDIKELGVLGGGSVLQEPNGVGRKIIGKGSFVGEDCLRQYNEFVSLSSSTGSGVLCLPGLKPFYARLIRVELDCSPAPDLVSYSFEFREDLSASNYPSEKVYHSIHNGQDLWDVSHIYGVPIERLVELNPHIRFINDLVYGTEVRVC